MVGTVKPGPSVWLLVRPLVLIPATLLWLATAIYIYWFLAPVVLRSLHYNDFGKFYYSLRASMEGGSLYGPTIATWIDFKDGNAAHFWNMNPPHAHLLFWPFGWLSIGSAFALWTAINVLAAGWAVWVTARATGTRPAWWVIALALVSEAALAWAVTGQLVGLLMAAVTALWLAIRRQQWIRAGVLLGLTCSVKPFLGVFILSWVIERRWRALVWTSCSAAAAVLLGVLVYGASAYEEWAGVLGDVQWTGAAMNASVVGMVGRTWTAQALVRDPTAIQIGTALALALVALGVWVAARTRETDRAVLILLLTALIASPLGWMYYLWMISGPALVIWRSPPRLVQLGLVGTLVPHVLIWPFSSTLWAATIGSLYFWSLLVLWIGTLIRDKRAITPVSSRM